ncbi:MAG: hypothetical protein U1F61_20165 [Opitutaceae bacterium]
MNRRKRKALRIACDAYLRALPVSARPLTFRFDVVEVSDPGAGLRAGRAGGCVRAALCECAALPHLLPTLVERANLFGGHAPAVSLPTGNGRIRSANKPLASPDGRADKLTLVMAENQPRHPFLQGLSKHRGAPPTVVVIFAPPAT